MATRWTRVHGGPAGVVPGGLATRIGVGAVTVLLAGMFLSTLFTGSDEASTGSDETLAGLGGFAARLRDRLAEERRRQEAEQEISDRRAAANAAGALQERIALADVTNRMAPPDGAPRPAGRRAAAARPEWMGDTFTDAELELYEALYLERVEREERSLRAPIVAQTRRGAAPALEIGGAEAASSAPPPAAETQTQVVVNDVLTALGLGTAPADIAAGGSVASELLVARPEDLMRRQAAVAAGDAAATRLVSPVDPPGWERVYEGTFLEGVLVNQLSGEFPGPVLAQVSVPLYSRNRQRVLVPRGARVLGTAAAVGTQDQTRLAVGFDRLIFPDGQWLALRFEGLNQMGETALTDEIDRHYLSTFGAAGAVGVLAGLTLQGSNPYAGGLAGFRAGAGQGLGQAAAQILGRYMNRLPTITIRAGHRIRIWLTGDVLVPVGGSADVR